MDPPKGKSQTIHKGLFIADERRKGDQGRIKSQSIDNKIDVQFKRGQAVLHESEVEWVEIRRYNRKEGKKNQRKPPQNKNSAFKEKQDSKSQF